MATTRAREIIDEIIARKNIIQASVRSIVCGQRCPVSLLTFPSSSKYISYNRRISSLTSLEK